MDGKTIETYNLMAKDYDMETADFWERFPRTMLDLFAKSVHGPVLDVGSGPGRDALLLRERGIDVTCIDASHAMIDLCKEKGLCAIAADFNELPFDDGSFHGVWAYTSLLHVPKAEVALPMEEIARVLKSGGMLGLGLIEGEEELYRESSGMNRPRWFSFYTKQEVETLLKQFGFEVQHFDEFKPASKNYLHFLAKKR